MTGSLASTSSQRRRCRSAARLFLVVVLLLLPAATVVVAVEESRTSGGGAAGGGVLLPSPVVGVHRRHHHHHKHRHHPHSTTKDDDGATVLILEEKPFPETSVSAASDDDGEDAKATAVTQGEENEPQRRTRRRSWRFVSSHPDAVFVTCLAVLTGTCDTVCFRRFGCFANMMTGNTIRMAFAVSDCQWDRAAYHAAMIAAYVSGSALYRYVDDAHRRHQHRTIQQQTDNSRSQRLLLSPSTSLPSVAMTALGLFVSADLLTAIFFSAPSEERRRWLAPLLSLPFGLIHAATLKATGGCVTNAATGHYTKIGLAVASALAAPSDNNPQQQTGGTNNNILSTAGPSLNFALTFLASLVGSSALYGWILKTENPHVKAIFNRLPPLGTTLGVLYFVLLNWYEKSSTTTTATTTAAAVASKKTEKSDSNGANELGSPSEPDTATAPTKAHHHHQHRHAADGKFRP